MLNIAEKSLLFLNFSLKKKGNCVAVDFSCLLRELAFLQFVCRRQKCAKLFGK